MNISYKNNNIEGHPVALGLPFVAQMLPSGCPSAAGGLPESCLQVAETLP
jgi:hypothetical protein